MSIINDIRIQIKNLEKSISDIQGQCSHPIALQDLKENSSSRWSLDGQDCTITVVKNFTCRLCEKQWTRAEMSYE